jgi:hypothetical protein
MKKSNGHFLKGTVKRVCGALALAAALAVTPVIFDGCQNQTGMEQNGQKEYDANGWNKHDPNDLINGITKTIYDKDGYNRAGYNEYGWDRKGNNENGTPYDDNGFKMDETYLETGDYYDPNGYKVDGYNDDGWYRDPTNLINKFTGKEYDMAGYDRAGWNTFNPSDKMNKNGTLYDANGYDRDGNLNPALGGGGEEVVIPEYDDGDMNVELGTVYGNGAYNIKLQWPTSDPDHITDIGELLRDNWFPKLKTQAGNLNEGYSKAASKYPAYSSQFSGIAAGEDQTMVDIMTNDGNITNIVNSVFGADTANKDQFNAELAAYQQGHYINKKQRIDSTSGGNPQTWAQMTVVLEPLLDGLPLTPISKDANGAITPSSLATMLGELKTLMLVQLNNATGVGTSAAIIGEDQMKIQALNAHLLQQIGDDRGEVNALTADIYNIGYTPTNMFNIFIA